MFLPSLTSSPPFKSACWLIYSIIVLHSFSYVLPSIGIGRRRPEPAQIRLPQSATPSTSRVRYGSTTRVSTTDDSRPPMTVRAVDQYWNLADTTSSGQVRLVASDLLDNPATEARTASQRQWLLCWRAVNTSTR